MMRAFAIALLVSSSVLGTAQAATLDEGAYVAAGNSSHMSTFAGARIRASLGGSEQEPDRFRASLAIAPMQRSRADPGTPLAHIGDGLEFGFTDRTTTPHFSLAGRSLSRRYGVADDGGSDEGTGGLETAAYVIGGLLLVAGIGALVVYEVADDASE